MEYQTLVTTAAPYQQNLQSVNPLSSVETDYPKC